MPLGDGKYRQVIRSTARDRNGFKLDPRGVVANRYKLNPVVLLEHSTMVIGKTTKLTVTDECVVAEYQYAPTNEAALVARLDDAGFIPAASVGYIPLKWKEVSGGIDVAEWELVEWSKVHIPADPFAVGGQLTQ